MEAASPDTESPRGRSANCTTMSYAGRIARRTRNVSRSTRFTLFRSTARFSWRLPTMSPNRAPASLLLVAYNRKLPDRNWMVRADNTASNWRFSVRRYSRGKRSIAASSSHRQTLSALRSARIDDLLAVASRHPGTKAVRSLALQHAGLEGALHDDSTAGTERERDSKEHNPECQFSRKSSCSWDRKDCCCLLERSKPVNNHRLPRDCAPRSRVSSCGYARWKRSRTSRISAR